MEDTAFVREFQGLVSDVKHVRETIDKMAVAAEKRDEAVDEKFTSHEQRIRDLEKWRWIQTGLSVGGGAVGGGAAVKLLGGPAADVLSSVFHSLVLFLG